MRRPIPAVQPGPQLAEVADHAVTCVLPPCIQTFRFSFALCSCSFRLSSSTDDVTNPGATSGWTGLSFQRCREPRRPISARFPGRFALQRFFKLTSLSPKAVNTSPILHQRHYVAGKWTGALQVSARSRCTHPTGAAVEKYSGWIQDIPTALKT